MNDNTLLIVLSAIALLPMTYYWLVGFVHCAKNKALDKTGKAMFYVLFCLSLLLGTCVYFMLSDSFDKVDEHVMR